MNPLSPASGCRLQVVDHLPEHRLVQDLLLLSTSSHQGVRAYQVNLTRYPLGVVVGLGHEPVAEQPWSPIARHLHLMPNLGPGLRQVQGSEMIAYRRPLPQRLVNRQSSFRWKDPTQFGVSDQDERRGRLRIHPCV